MRSPPSLAALAPRIVKDPLSIKLPRRHARFACSARAALSLPLAKGGFQGGSSDLGATSSPLPRAVRASPPTPRRWPHLLAARPKRGLVKRLIHPQPPRWLRFVRQTHTLLMPPPRPPP